MTNKTSTRFKNKTLTQIIRAFFCLAPLLANSPNLVAKDSSTIFGRYEHNEVVPSVKQILGYPLGSRINWTADARKYFEALQRHAPPAVPLRRRGGLVEEEGPGRRAGWRGSGVGRVVGWSGG